MDVWKVGLAVPQVQDEFARNLALASLGVAGLSFAYSIFRDWSSRPKVRVTMSTQLWWDTEGEAKGKGRAELSITVMNRRAAVVGIQGLDLRYVGPRIEHSHLAYVYPEEQDPDPPYSRSLDRPVTLQGHHSHEWRAMPRFIYSPGMPSPPTRAKMECHVTLGDGKIVKSQTVDVPGMERSAGNPDLTVDDLPDENEWFMQDED